jgi:hypothetical protein
LADARLLPGLTASLLDAAAFCRHLVEEGTVVIATVVVLQALEGLSDRDACWMLRNNISWKVACGLPLDDEGFHPTVLVLWRNKLRASDNPERIFEAVRKVVDESGVLKKQPRPGPAAL